ncbi:MAG: DHH family phosphoesterase [archaeon]
MEEKLKEIVRNKRVKLCCHWDADGVSSGALIYHIIKDEVESITTISKGKKFIIEKEDIGDEEVIICVDIQPGDIFDRQIIYIDHHPSDLTKKYSFLLHDEQSQSCSLLIYQKLITDKTNPYFIFLTLLGYFGDQGKKENIPKELKINANNFIPDLMVKKQSYYDDGNYLEIEKYVSMLNTGKRKNWSGDIPLELLKCIETYEPMIYNLHPIAQQLQDYKKELRDLYSKKHEIKEINGIDIVILSSDKNIQGVIAARNIKNKPILVVNQLNNEMIGSMRVPDNLDFNAGKFLDSFNGKLPSYLGGGHEKAGGFTLDIKEFNDLIELIKEK